ncbi:MAG: ECF transporter S component [Bacillota bacterium]|nr:ECF transporter S component [Bacillota bacterium]
MKNKPIYRMVLSALFAAIICVATFIHMPTPGGGYIHPGDCFILLAAWSVGPLYGAVAAGIGSAMTDLLMGYSVYAPATLIIKALMAVIAALSMRLLKKKIGIYPAAFIGSVLAELFMVLGYFCYEFILLRSSALASVPSNFVQAAGGVILSLILLVIILKNRILRAYLSEVA